MAGDDEKKLVLPPRQRRARERVTLNAVHAPLLLPGEGEGPAGDDVAILSTHRADTPPGENVDGADGWERQRRAITPPPMPAVGPTSRPPAGEAANALELAERRSRPSNPALDLASEMTDRYALGDYTAALRLAELILGRDPSDENANRTARACRERLAQLYGSRLGSLARVPQVAVDLNEVRWLGLDHRAGFLLSRVDGSQTIDEVIDVSGMPRLEALKLLVELLDMGAIRFVD